MLVSVSSKSNKLENSREGSYEKLGNMGKCKQTFEEEKDLTSTQIKSTSKILDLILDNTNLIKK